jgi:hypothetical protein
LDTRGVVAGVDDALPLAAELLTDIGLDQG